MLILLSRDTSNEVMDFVAGRATIIPFFCSTRPFYTNMMPLFLQGKRSQTLQRKLMTRKVRKLRLWRERLKQHQALEGFIREGSLNDSSYLLSLVLDRCMLFLTRMKILNPDSVLTTLLFSSFSLGRNCNPIF